MIKPKVEQLAEETDERAQFLVGEHGQGVCIDRVTGTTRSTHRRRGRQAERDTRDGRRQVHLAQYGEERVRQVIEHRGLLRPTEHTTTDKGALFGEFDGGRERGYATNDEENIRGIRAVGVPVMHEDSRPIGGLSISGLVQRMKGEWFDREVPTLLPGTTNELDLNIAYS